MIIISELWGTRLYTMQYLNWMGHNYQQAGVIVSWEIISNMHQLWRIGSKKEWTYKKSRGHGLKTEGNWSRIVLFGISYSEQSYGKRLLEIYCQTDFNYPIHYRTEH